MKNRNDKNDITHFRNVSEKLNMLWLAPPRNATRQTYQFLKNFDFKIKTDYKEIIKQEIIFPFIPNSNYTHDFDILPDDNYKILCSIRNPYSRIVSLLKYHNIFKDKLISKTNKNAYSTHKNFKKLLNENKISFLNEESFNKIFEEKLKFNEWIDKCFISKTIHKIWLDQINYHEYLKIYKPDYYIKIENLVDDIKNIPEFKNKKINNKILLKNLKTEIDEINNEDDWRDLYNQDIADLVYNNLKEQFDMFGYDKDSWKKPNKLNLKNITLILIDGVNPENALKSILYSIKNINFNKVKLLTYRKPKYFNYYKHLIEYIKIDKLTYYEYNWFKLKKLSDYIDTEYCLTIETDGFILNYDQWNDEFLNYDYIGAPWPKDLINKVEYLNENNRVGNSGFSLRSKKLIELSKLIPDNEKNNNPLEDVLICRKYRNIFLDNNIKFSPPELAIKFSLEIINDDIYNKNLKPFGFHKSYDYKKILNNVNLSKPYDILNNEILKNINIKFIDGVKIENLSNNKYTFEAECKSNNNEDSNNIKIINDLNANSNIYIPISYYKKWSINIKDNDKIIYHENFNLKNENVLVVLLSASLGDTLAWIPYVDIFRKKHKCNIYCITYFNDLFINVYKDINFLESKEGVYNLDINIYARYAISMNYTWEFININNTKQGLKTPNDFRKIPLQQISTDILGLNFKEIKPKIFIPEINERPIKDKYICISEFSGHGKAKFWNYKNGWQELVDWLNKQNYKVLVISKEKTNLKNIIDHTGDYPIEKRINELFYCDFFIGVSSGLAWLAWALNKKVVMISGVTDIFNEFKKDNTRIINHDVCHGCWHRHSINIEKDNEWCPDHKGTINQYECTKKINTNMVISKIKNLI